MFQKSNLGLILLCSTLASTLSAQAATTPATKIGVINLQAVIVNTREGQKASQQLQQTYSSRQKDFQARSDELVKLNDQLKTGGALLSDEKRNELTADIAEKKRRLDRDIQDAQADLNQQQQQVLNGMEQKLRPLIDKYAKDNNFALILDVGQSSPVVFAAPVIDCTKDVIDLYDRAHPVTASAPAQSTSTTTAPSVPGQVAPRPAPGTPAHPPSQ